MGQVLHGSATTTEAIHRAIQHRQESLRALAKRYGVNQKTVRKWKGRSSVADMRTGPTQPPVASGEDQKKQVENARVQIYDSAKKECDQLSLSFDAHCRLVTLNINVNNQIIGTTPTINANGFAVYELDPEPQTSPRRR